MNLGADYLVISRSIISSDFEIKNREKEIEIRGVKYPVYNLSDLINNDKLELDQETDIDLDCSLLLFNIEN